MKIFTQSNQTILLDIPSHTKNYWQQNVKAFTKIDFKNHLPLKHFKMLLVDAFHIIF